MKYDMKFFARLLISLIFLVAGLFKILFFEQTVGFLASTGFPLASVGVVVALIIEIGGGLALTFGYKIKEVSWVLIGFVILTSILFNRDLANQAIMYDLLKNLAIIGALLYVIDDQGRKKKRR